MAKRSNTSGFNDARRPSDPSSHDQTTTGSTTSGNTGSLKPTEIHQITIRITAMPGMAPDAPDKTTNRGV